MTAQDIEQTLSFEQMSTIWHSLADRESITSESVLRRKDGSMFPVEIRQFHPSNLPRTSASFCASMRDITERKQASEALQASLMEKEALLMEVHHRVKNNLAAIIALLEMQRQTLDDSASTALLESGRPHQIHGPCS